MLRRRLRTPNLVLEAIPIGTASNTNIAICYLKGWPMRTWWRSAKRVEGVNVEAMHSVNVISEIVADVRYTPFRLFATTERPDKLAAAWLKAE